MSLGGPPLTDFLLIPRDIYMRYWVEVECRLRLVSSVDPVNGFLDMCILRTDKIKGLRFQSLKQSEKGFLQI